MSTEVRVLFSDVACDSRSNTIVSDKEHGHIHLLGPDGRFVKYLLTQDEIRHPSSMSLINYTLWVGNTEGFVKEFVSSNMKLPRGCPFFKLNRMMLQFFLLDWSMRFIFWAVGKINTFKCWHKRLKYRGINKRRVSVSNFCSSS